MKKLFIGLMMIGLLTAGSICVYAAPGRGHNNQGKPQDRGDNHDKSDFHGRPDYHEREDGRYIIHRTAMAFNEAQRFAEHGHYYSGYAEMVAHQQRARELYMQGYYREAIFHSLRARELALAVIRGNHGRYDRDFSRDDREEVYYRDSPRGNDLDMRLDMRRYGRDDEAFRMRLDFDID
jgi:hypothetical protein